MGCALMSVKDRLRYRHFLLLVLATWGGLTLTVVSGRYRLMFAPGVFTFAAIAVCLLIDSAKRKKFLSRSWILLLVAAVVAVVPEPKIDHQKERAQAWTILGEAAMNSNRPDLAKFYLDLAMKSLRITSYNVCYTKLLRYGDALVAPYDIGVGRIGNGRERGPAAARQGSVILARVKPYGQAVITSYSIHYTKLYECSFSVRPLA